MKKSKRKATNIFIYLLSFTSAGLGIFLNLFLARILGAASYGRIQYLIALSTTISQFLVFGLNTYLIKETKNEKHHGQIFNLAISFYSTVLIFLIPILYFVLINYVEVCANNEVVTLSVILVSILIGISSIISSFYQGAGKLSSALIFENLIPKFSLFVISLVCLLIGKLGLLEDRYLLFYIVIYSAIAIPILFIHFRKFNLRFESNDIKSICFFFGVTITYSLGNNLTKVLQGGLYRNDVALAIIAVSLSIISLVRVATGVLDSIIKPIFAKRKRENDQTGIINIYRFDTRFNSYVSIPLYIFFALHSSKFLLLFGDSYLAYPYILVIIALANAISDLTGPNGTLLAMTGKEKYELFNGFIYFGVYFISIFIFSFDKIYGLCFALLTAQIVVNIVKYIEIWCIYKISPLNAKTLITMLLIIIVNFGLIFALRYIPVSTWLWFLISIPVGIIIVFINCFIVSLYRKTDFKDLLSLKL